MSYFRFPFNWGSVADAVPSVVTEAARWTALAATSKAWGQESAGPRRFERIYEQPRSVFGQSINFSFKISSQFPFKIETDTIVLIKSTITTP